MKEESHHVITHLDQQHISTKQYNTNIHKQIDKCELFCNDTQFEVVVLTTGIGMVNAATMTTHFLSKVRPDVILNVGCAGAHDKTLNLGDVVIGKLCLPTSNLIIDKDDDIHHYGIRLQNTDCIKKWNADYDLLKSVNYKDDDLKTYCGDKISTIVQGVIGSSDVWLDNIPKIKWAQQFFGTHCEEMEAAAIAQIAYFYKIPFLAIKDISNSVFRSSSFEGISHSVPTYAGRNSAIVASKLCKKIQENAKKINYIF